MPGPNLTPNGKAIYGPARASLTDVENIPATSSGADWLVWLFQRHQILPEIVAYSDWAARTDTRADTIGKFMYDYANPQLERAEP